MGARYKTDDAQRAVRHAASMGTPVFWGRSGTEYGLTGLSPSGVNIISTARFLRNLPAGDGPAAGQLRTSMSGGMIRDHPIDEGMEEPENWPLARQI
jgi:hypothetical protein